MKGEILFFKSTKHDSRHEEVKSSLQMFHEVHVDNTNIEMGTQVN